MKYFVAVILVFFINQPSSKIDEVRKQFPEIASEAQADDFIAILKNDDSPEGKGYTAAMVFMKSRFVNFPFTKLKYFKQGKLLLDQAIIESPSNIEIRYIRFLMQKQIPEFLGYHKNISEDYDTIVNGIDNAILNNEQKSKILQSMLETKGLSEIQKLQLNQLLKNL